MAFVRFRCLFGLLLPLGLAACAGVPLRGAGEPSAALAAPEETELWGSLVRPEEAEEGRSGFFFLEGGPDAYLTRLTVIEAAARTIDIQYYIWDFDGSGRAVSEALLRAADRGVRVRALVDGFSVGSDATPLLHIASHPNVEVRVHNAFRTTFRPDYLRYGELLLDFPRLNQRMHNKILAIDNTLAIVGGRNVSDTYFAVDEKRYFLDRDVVIAGPLAADVSRSFDVFWNSPYAVPVGAFAEEEPPPFDPASLWQDAPPLDWSGFPLPRRVEPEEMERSVARFRARLVWAPATLLLASPGPVFAAQLPPAERRIETVLLRHIRESEREIAIQMPYVMLTEERAEAFAEAHRRGVSIVLNTNSLASHESAIVHYGYARDRVRFIKRGVALHELKARPATSAALRGLGVEPEQTTLHSKTIVFDGRYVLIGSFNLDHRSIFHNSEIGVLIDSPELASRALAAMREDMAPRNSWRVVLEPPRRLVWLDETVQPARRILSEPETGPLSQIFTWLGYFLPIDGLI